MDQRHTAQMAVCREAAVGMAQGAFFWVLEGSAEVHGKAEAKSSYAFPTTSADPRLNGANE